MGSDRGLISSQAQGLLIAYLIIAGGTGFSLYSCRLQDALQSTTWLKHVVTFITNMVKDGQINLDMEDEIIAETLVTRDGEVTHPRVREILGLAAAA